MGFRFNIRIKYKSKSSPYITFYRDQSFWGALPLCKPSQFQGEKKYRINQLTNFFSLSLTLYLLFIYLFIFNKASFFFRAVLGSQQVWEKGTETSHKSFIPTYAYYPPINILHQSGTFVSTD